MDQPSSMSSTIQSQQACWNCSLLRMPGCPSCVTKPLLSHKLCHLRYSGYSLWCVEGLQARAISIQLQQCSMYLVWNEFTIDFASFEKPAEGVTAFAAVGGCTWKLMGSCSDCTAPWSQEANSKSFTPTVASRKAIGDGRNTSGKAVLIFLDLRLMEILHQLIGDEDSSIYRVSTVQGGHSMCICILYVCMYGYV